MSLKQNPHQTVILVGSVSFSMYACGFSVPQMRQFCLFTYLPRSKWASSEEMVFFLPKSASSVSRLQAHFSSVVQAYTQAYSFGGRIKIIICQIRHVLSVTIHEVSISWKKTLDGGSYIFFKKCKRGTFVQVYSILTRVLIYSIHCFCLFEILQFNLLRVCVCTNYETFPVVTN